MKLQFDDACMVAFLCLNEKLISNPIIISPDSLESFELMRDACGTTLVVLLGQKGKKLFSHQLLCKKNSKQFLT